MRVQEKYRQTLDEITGRLAAIRTIVPGGRPGFRAGEYSLLISILESAIDLNPVIPHYDRPGLLRNAVSDAAKEPALTTETLHNHLTRAENKYLAAPLEKSMVPDKRDTLLGRSVTGKRASVLQFQSREKSAYRRTDPAVDFPA
jgi:hypothetical protein